MILKIARIESKSNVTTPWVIFSELLNVYYVTITGEHYKKLINSGHGDEANRREEFPFDYTAVIGEPKKVVTVEATRKNGATLYVAFNTVGYLMNDEGKTIETLNL